LIFIYTHSRFSQARNSRYMHKKQDVKNQDSLKMPNFRA